MPYLTSGNPAQLPTARRMLQQVLVNTPSGYTQPEARRQLLPEPPRTTCFNAAVQLAARRITPQTPEVVHSDSGDSSTKRRKLPQISNTVRRNGNNQPPTRRTLLRVPRTDQYDSRKQDSSDKDSDVVSDVERTQRSTRHFEKDDSSTRRVEGTRRVAARGNHKDDEASSRQGRLRSKSEPLDSEEVEMSRTMRHAEKDSSCRRLPSSRDTSDSDESDVVRNHETSSPYNTQKGNDCQGERSC